MPDTEIFDPKKRTVPSHTPCEGVEVSLSDHRRCRPSVRILSRCSILYLYSVRPGRPAGQANAFATIIKSLLALSRALISEMTAITAGAVERS